MAATLNLSKRQVSLALTITIPATLTWVVLLARARDVDSPHRYRPPGISLVLPGVGQSIPRDRPVVVFRLVPGEIGDPIDAASFSVLVDGRDRTPLFRVAAAEAWGSLADGSEREGTGLLKGSHMLEAKVCSVRGVCAATASAILVR
jgi:hypothetical protein